MQFEMIENDSTNNFNIDFIRKKIKKVIKGADELDNRIAIPSVNMESDEV